MLLVHAIALAEARSYLSALADLTSDAGIPDASLAYENALLYLDAVHGDQVPAAETIEVLVERPVLHALAEAAVEELATHGLDPLHLELALAMLHDARKLDKAQPDFGG